MLLMINISRSRYGTQDSKDGISAEKRAPIAVVCVANEEGTVVSKTV